MKHEPQQPIRPRLRGTPGLLVTASAGQQPTKRVVIRVPLVATEANPSTRHTTPERPGGSAAATLNHESPAVAPPATAKPQPSLHTTSVERVIRIDGAHETVPSPHTAPVTTKPSSGWLGKVLQQKTLLAVGLIVSILILAVVIHQRSAHESAADSTTPHPRFAKSERHASLTRKSQVDAAANRQPLAAQPRRAQAATATMPPILRQSLGTDFTNGPALYKSDVAPTNVSSNSTSDAATNVPAALGAGADTNAIPTDVLPKMPDLNPPREAVAPPVNSGAPEAQYFGFAPGEGGSAISVATRGSANFDGTLVNSPIPTHKK